MYKQKIRRKLWKYKLTKGLFIVINNTKLNIVQMVDQDRIIKINIEDEMK